MYGMHTCTCRSTLHWIKEITAISLWLNQWVLILLQDNLLLQYWRFFIITYSSQYSNHTLMFCISLLSGVSFRTYDITREFVTNAKTILHRPIDLLTAPSMRGPCIVRVQLNKRWGCTSPPPRSVAGFDQSNCKKNKRKNDWMTEVKQCLSSIIFVGMNSNKVIIILRFHTC